MSEEKKILPVYILIRTSKRPKFFAKLMESIKVQTYPNIKTIVHTDDPNDTYIEGDIIIKGERKQRTKDHKAPYNLYNNVLLQSIPEGPGWYHFVDDDDVYVDPDGIAKVIPQCKENCINVFRVRRWDRKVVPQKWQRQRSYQTECFILHTKHKNLATWWDHLGGDHDYSKKITAKLQINWIENIILCAVQEGKGYGDRFDFGDAKQINPRMAEGLEVPDKSLVDVLFKIYVRFPQECKGREGEIKKIPMWRARDLENRGKVIINPTKENIQQIREQLKKRMPLSIHRHKSKIK
jgi:hypothetical protein